MTGTINAIENNINHNIQGAIFDVDGTLLDSMSVWEDIGERYLISLGIMAKDGLGDALHTMSLEQGAVYLKEESHPEYYDSIYHFMLFLKFNSYSFILHLSL